MLGITLNNDVIHSVTINAHFLWSSPIAFIFTSGKNAIDFGLFCVAIASFIYVIIVGWDAFFIKTFEDIKTIEEVDRFSDDDSITKEQFVEGLGNLLYGYIKINEKHIAKKGRAARRMMWAFLFGVVIFIIRFGAIILM